MINNINMLSEQVTRVSQGGSNAFTWIILSIFFGIIIILIIVASVGAKKDKVEKMFESDKRSKEIEAADTNRVLIFSSLNKIVIDLNKELEDFKPSVGTKSLGAINNEYIQKLKNIYKSKEVNEIFAFSDYKIELKPVLDELNNTKPSNWSKEATFATNLVKVKFDAISKNKDNKKLIIEGEKRGWK